MKNYLVVFSLIFSYLLMGCNFFIETLPITSGVNANYQSFSVKHYNNLVTSENNVSIISANLVKESEYLRIFLKEGQEMSYKDISYIADNFDLLYPKMIDIYGEHTDVDRNNKITVLLYDINVGYSNGDAYIAGYFNPYDLFGLNHAEILYVESQASGDIENIFTTLIHEFQHLINFNENYFENNEKPCDLWLNEALSESTNILIFEELKKNAAMPTSRLQVYNSTPSRSISYHDIISAGNYFYTWDSNSQSILADYATASLFMYWLYLHYDGEDIIRKISKGANKGTYQAVLDSLGTTDSWEDLMMRWLSANHSISSGYPNGKQAYWRNGELVVSNLTLTPKIYRNYGETVNLYPGDMLLTEVEPEILPSLTRSANPIIEQSDFSISNAIQVYFTYNSKDSTPGTYISVKLPEVELQSMFSYSMQRSYNYTPDIGYKIVPVSQQPIDSF